MLQSTAKAPPRPPKKPKWTCTVCLTTMSPKDSTAHEQGKRHTAALAKLDKAGAYTAKHTEANGANVKVVPPTLSPKSEASAPPAPTATRTTTTSSPSSKPRAKAPKKKGKPTVKPNQATAGAGPPGAGPPPTSADPYYGRQPSWDRDEGWFDDPFSSYGVYVGSQDYSICDKDCGWCGRCMGELSYEYDFAFLALVLPRFVDQIEGRGKWRIG